MNLTIGEALELEILHGFKLLAGKKGLSNPILNVAVWDYETGELIEENFRRGDFVLSTLVAIKDKIEELEDNFQRLIDVGISALAIRPVYIEKVPEHIIRLAEKKNVPLMIFGSTATEDVIVGINKAIVEKQGYQKLTMKIDDILFLNLNEEGIRGIARKINPHFMENNMVAFCRKKSSKSKWMINVTKEEIEEIGCKVIPFKNGQLVINTFEKSDPKEIEKTIFRRLEWLGFTRKDYVIGVSSLYNSLGELSYPINESLYAFRYAKLYKKDISFFNEIGVNKVILPILDNPWVMKYYNQMIEPLLKYDRNNETELLKTAIAYVENNGDIRATAEELFQHGNTIRYRIDRINKIMCENSNILHFYEELAVMVRIYRMMNNTL
jgi:hypothetical protein